MRVVRVFTKQSGSTTVPSYVEREEHLESEMSRTKKLYDMSTRPVLINLNVTFSFLKQYLTEHG